MDWSLPGSFVQVPFSRQEYWGGLPCPPPGHLPDPGIKPVYHVFNIGRRVLSSPAPPGKLSGSILDAETKMWRWQGWAPQWMMHCRWHRIHSITRNNPIYDVTSTSRITSHPNIRHCTHCIFVITTSPLISHPLFNDITPSFCVTSYALYRTSHPILMSLQYSTYDITASIYETTSSMRATYTLNMWHHSHYLCHHTHCIDNITPILFMTSHSPYVGHHLHYTRHHILNFWLQTTILRTSHPLY